MPSPADTHFMTIALRLARRGVGTTAPNPSVGCVVAKDGRIVGQGTTAPGGRPHAETIALAQAGKDARDGTLYVTLEPCSHHGKTPPCTEAIIRAGIARVVIANRDDYPDVNGQGIEQLKKAGIAVELGLLAAEAEKVHAGFFSGLRRNRPLVTLKLASTLDGKIATQTGESRWITGEQARRYAHFLRYRHHAVMTGVNTVLADDPELTCRLPGLEAFSPVRVILDSTLRTPQEAKIIPAAGHPPTWIVTSSAKPSPYPPGVDILRVSAATEGEVNLREALTTLAGRGVTRLLAEGGGTLAASLLKENLVDRLVWFHAPALLGGEARPAVGGLGIARIAGMRRFKIMEIRRLGEDVMTILDALPSPAAAS